ncbi:MAG: glycosyltransferase [Candidatus Nanosynbacter sp.]|nr:glycosyltransferase [Candidatus Nanosynbacter sp.]
MAESKITKSKMTESKTTNTKAAKLKIGKPKIALVCDWLTVVGGAEQVLRELHRIYPDAPIYTSQYRPKGINWFLDAEVKTGWLNLLPACLRKFIAPLRQNYFKHLDLTAYDLVISVSGCDAKFVKTKPGAHICYCHVPTQYYWGKYSEYLEDPGFGKLNFLVRPVFKLMVKTLRRKDLEAAARPDYYLTISDFAEQEIKQFYKRESAIIYPPVAVENFQAVAPYRETIRSNCQILSQHNSKKKQTKIKLENNIKHSKSQIISEKSARELPKILQKLPESFLVEGFYLNFSRQVNWKRLDLIIAACKKLQLNLVLIGNGAAHELLVNQVAGSKHVVFFDVLPQSDLKEFVKYAKAFIFPSNEPFGIAPVEALAAGCPVIALKQGGAMDYIQNGKNGLFFEEQSVDSLVQTLKNFEAKSVNSFLSPQEISATVTKFSTENFHRKIRQFVEKVLKTQKT